MLDKLREKVTMLALGNREQSMNRTWSPFGDVSTTSENSTLSGSTVAGGEARARVRVRKVQKATDPIKVQSRGQITSTTISFRNLDQHGKLLARYLEVRKEIFLNRLDWHVYETDGMEFDQYDTPACRWIVLHRDGEILGGLRMLPTTARCGIYSYMIRDAQLGHLENMPRDILHSDAPVDKTIWEATRIFITDAVSARERLEVQTKLFLAMSQTALENGGTHILGIVPGSWARWGRRLGAIPKPIGPKVTIDGKQNQAVLFKASDLRIQA